MKSNYDVLGKHIRLIDIRNRESITDKVLGINIEKFFMPSVANVIGTDLSKYKLITKGKFSCNPMHVGRDERLPVALYDEEEPAIVSPAYFMFEIIDNNILDEHFLMMWFRRPEFDRICWFHTDGSVRGGITWKDICRLEFPLPSIEKQREIVVSALGQRPMMDKPFPDERSVTRMIEFWRGNLAAVLPDHPDLIVVYEDCDNYPLYTTEESLAYYECRGERVRDFFAEEARANHCYIAYCAYRSAGDGSWRNCMELIGRNGIYAEFWRQQMGTEEDV